MRKNKIIYPDPLILHSAINSRFGDFVNRIYPIGLLMKYSTYLTRYASRIELHLDTESQDQIGTKRYDAVFIHHVPTGLQQEHLPTIPTLIFILLVVELSNLCNLQTLDLYLF